MVRTLSPESLIPLARRASELDQPVAIALYSSGLTPQPMEKIIVSNGNLQERARGENDATETIRDATTADGTSAWAPRDRLRSQLTEVRGYQS
jgi:hypothetical protein